MGPGDGAEGEVVVVGGGGVGGGVEYANVVFLRCAAVVAKQSLGLKLFYT